MRNDVRDTMNGSSCDQGYGQAAAGIYEASPSKTNIATEPTAQQYLDEIIAYTFQKLEGYKALSRALPREMNRAAEQALRTIYHAELRRMQGW